MKSYVKLLGNVYTDNKVMDGNVFNALILLVLCLKLHGRATSKIGIGTSGTLVQRRSDSPGHYFSSMAVAFSIARVSQILII